MTQELITVNVWEVLELLEAEVVKLHQLHSWERLDIDESNTRRELEWSLMLHVFRVIEDSIPDWLGFLRHFLGFTHWSWIMLVKICLSWSEETGCNSDGLHLIDSL